MTPNLLKHPRALFRGKHRGKLTTLCFLNFILIAILLASCTRSAPVINFENMITPLAPTPIPAPKSERPEYKPGELVDYIAQNGDTLPALAAHFNTTIEEILAAN